MIPAITSNAKFHNVIISTGNILNVNNQLGGKSSEELLDGLKLTLQCTAAASQVELNEVEGQVLRATQELNQKLTENVRTEISIGAKLFLNKNSSACIEQAVGALLQILNVQHVDNLVLAYHPKVVHAQHINNTAAHTEATVSPAGNSILTDGSSNSESEQMQMQLQELWTSLEKYAQRKQIIQLGIADLDIERLQQLCAAAKVQPTIMQINLASCCVVPPELKAYCTKHDIQLLTHNDPEVLLSDEQFIVPGYEVEWTLRYQVHVRCRGVLTAKGYILGASKIKQTAATASNTTSNTIV